MSLFIELARFQLYPLNFYASQIEYVRLLLELIVIWLHSQKYLTDDMHNRD